MENVVEDKKFISTMESIVSSIEQAGMDPYEQIYGYLTTGKEIYITRNGNARELIQTLDKDDISRYIATMNNTAR